MDGWMDGWRDCFCSFLFVPSFVRLFVFFLFGFFLFLLIIKIIVDHHC